MIEMSIKFYDEEETNNELEEYIVHYASIPEDENFKAYWCELSGYHQAVKKRYIMDFFYNCDEYYEYEFIFDEDEETTKEAFKEAVNNIHNIIGVSDNEDERGEMFCKHLNNISLKEFSKYNFIPSEYNNV